MSISTTKRRSFVSSCINCWNRRSNKIFFGTTQISSIHLIYVCSNHSFKSMSIFQYISVVCIDVSANEIVFPSTLTHIRLSSVSTLPRCRKRLIVCIISYNWQYIPMIETIDCIVTSFCTNKPVFKRIEN